MGGQLDGNFLPVSLSDKFILIVTLIICFVVNKFFSLSLNCRRRDAGQSGSYAYIRSDVVRHAKCKHAVNCCIILGLNCSTKRHATTVIYRLTVHTLPDGLETQFTPPDTMQTVLSCLVWRAV